MRHIRLVAVFGLSLAFTTGCAHGGASRATHSTGPAPVHPSDGITVPVALPLADAVDATIDVLEAIGYEIAARRRDGTLRTRPRVVAGDTTLIVTAQLFAVDGPRPHSLVALSASYSVPSGGARNAQVTNAPGAPATLWAQLRRLEAALRQLRPAAPAS